MSDGNEVVAIPVEKIVARANESASSCNHSARRALAWITVYAYVFGVEIHDKKDEFPVGAVLIALGLLAAVLAAGARQAAIGAVKENACARMAH